MGGHQGYRVQRLSRARLGLAAGQELARRRHLMFALVEADLTEPLKLMAEYQANSGEKLSLSGYVSTCLARTLAEFPQFNAFRRGRSLVLLDEVIVVVILERQLDDQAAVGYLPIRRADTKSLLEVTREIRAEQAAPPAVIAGQYWLERTPASFAPLLMKWATRSIRWGLRYGVAGVNNLGLDQNTSGWGLAPGAGTVAVTIGGINTGVRVDGTACRTAHLTLAFDHDVVDGAPAARFTSRLLQLLASGETARMAERWSHDSEKPKPSGAAHAP